MFSPFARVRRSITSRVSRAVERVRPFATKPGFFSYGGVKTVHLGVYVDQPSVVKSINAAAAAVAREARREHGPSLDGEIAAIARKTWVVLHEGESFRDGPVETTGMVRRWPRWPHLVAHFAIGAKGASLEGLLTEAWCHELGLATPQSQGANLGVVA